ncbi:hypothetical protein [Photobacterium leiognathi]|uniref:hypothetical protein n=1 Tax=Photobacterium leiognathi TaxID=553611 RepID=UPI00273A36B4|nr:hypothetical protein [Photobacterium leiognathi]
MKRYYSTCLVSLLFMLVSTIANANPEICARGKIVRIYQAHESWPDHALIGIKVADSNGIDKYIFTKGGPDTADLNSRYVRALLETSRFALSENIDVAAYGNTGCPVSHSGGVDWINGWQGIQLVED